MGKFRDRMLEDLQIRGLSPCTQKAYLSCTRRFVEHFMLPPDQLTPEHVRQYQLHLTRDRQVASGTFNQNVAAIKFFLRVTLRKDWAIDRIPYRKRPRTLPRVLSRENVAALLSCVQNLKHRTLLMVCYSGGLRATEAVRLQVRDIDSQRMTIRVDQGKGRKDRYVMLSPRLLETLREYWKTVRPTTWLFPGRAPDRPLSRFTLNRLTEKARKAAGLPDHLHPHLLLHTLATHFLEDGVNLCVIQRLLGHRSLRSTEIYTHVASDFLQRTASPLDRLPAPPQAPTPAV
ncbi:MAG: site-specific integrase [Candidatus Riflebacteria bacterium]|nr:site-specific integrase [Candidatus Riflebacteria bacterium]